MGHPSPRAIREAGYAYANCYLDFEGNRRTGDLTPEYVRELVDGGIGIGAIWETTARRPMAGRGAGVADAHAANAEAYRVGLPHEMVIRFCVDFDAQSAEFGTIAEYFRGIGEILPVSRIWVYGHEMICEYLLNLDLVSGCWQTTAWSLGEWSSANNEIQRVATVTVDGVNCDVNHYNNEVYPDLPGIWFGGDEMAPTAKEIAHEIMFNTPVLNADGVAIPNVNDTLYWTNAFANKIPALEAQNTALLAAVTYLIENSGSSEPAALKQAVLDAMAEGLVKVTIGIEQQQALSPTPPPLETAQPQA